MRSVQMNGDTGGATETEMSKLTDDCCEENLSEWEAFGKTQKKRKEF